MSYSQGRDGGRSCHMNYVELLDSMETKVESMRERASAIEMERETLISNLGRLKISKQLKCFTEEEREEIEATAQRLMNRVLTVEVNIITPRNEVQKKSIKKVNKLVDDLLIKLKTGHIAPNNGIERYINACNSDAVGPVDIKFQTLLLDCAADDQKRVRKRLESITETMIDSSFLMDFE